MANSKKFLDAVGVSYLWSKIKEKDTKLESDINKLRADVTEVKVYKEAIEGLQSVVPQIEESIRIITGNEDQNGSIDNKIAAYDETIQEQLKVKADASKTDTDILAVGLRVAETEKSITAQNESVNIINKTLETLNSNKNVVGSIDNKIDTAIKSIEPVDLSEIESDITNLEGRVNTLEQQKPSEFDPSSLQEQITSNAANIEELETRIDALEKEDNTFDPSSLQEQITSNATDIEELETRIDALEKEDNTFDPSSLQEQITDLENRVDTLEQSGGGSSFDPSSLQEQITSNATDIEGLETRIDALEQSESESGIKNITTIDEYLVIDKDELNNGVSIDIITSSIEEYSNIDAPKDGVATVGDIKTYVDEQIGAVGNTEALESRLTNVENWVGFNEPELAGTITFDDIDNLS